MKEVQQMKKSLLTSLLLTLSLVGCSEDGEVEITTEGGFVDTQAAIDVSRGDYACYQLVTSMGNIDIAVDERLAPITAANFKQYVDDEFYNGTIFHRVVKDFVVQGGGFTEELTAKQTRAAIKNESYNRLLNYRGRIAMARTNAPDSATSQFYFNTTDNHELDLRTGFDGYAVFGGVIAGMDIVDAMNNVDVSTQSGLTDVPTTAITLDSVAAMDCPAQ